MITVVLYIIILFYCLAIIVLIYGFTKIKTTESKTITPTTQFTIVVPFRNEAENLPVLLHSFSNLHYPSDLFEVILVDDGSLEEFQLPHVPFKISVINNIRVSNSPKKDAITTAMQIVTTDWIITTDADCTVQSQWLLILDQYIQNHAVAMIAGAVTYDCNDSFLHHFQQLDLASLQGATMGSFGIGKGFMCNGANFAYTKSIFQELKGFEGNDTIASGDDVFLLQKAIARYPEKIHYLKSTGHIVSTKPVNEWKSLFYQRVRWASKTSSYQSTFGKGLGVLVFTGNLSWLLLLGSCFLGLTTFQNFFIICVLKFSVDTLLIYKTNAFLTKNKMRYLILSSLFYPFFSVIVAFYSLFGKYEWKERKF